MSRHSRNHLIISIQFPAMFSHFQPYQDILSHFQPLKKLPKQRKFCQKSSRTNKMFRELCLRAREFHRFMVVWINQSCSIFVHIDCVLSLQTPHSPFLYQGCLCKFRENMISTDISDIFNSYYFNY